MPIEICQSCGMPLTNESNKGTNSDNTLNSEYCKFCFQNGKFTNENLTINKIINNSIKISMKLWMPEDKAREIAMNTIPKLKRWQK